MSDPHPRAEQIVAVARDAFAEHGYDATSMAEIARRVGVVEGAIYRYVPSKIELLNRVIASFYEPLIASTEAAIAGIESPRDRLRFVIWRQLRAMTEDRLLCRLVITEARTLDGYQQSAVADLSRRYTAIAMAAITDGMADGSLRHDLSPAMIRDVIYGSIEHIAWDALTDDGPHGALDADATADQLLSLLLHGVAEPGEAPTEHHHPPAADLREQLARLEALTDRLERHSA